MKKILFCTLGADMLRLHSCAMAVNRRKTVWNLSIIKN